MVGLWDVETEHVLGTGPQRDLEQIGGAAVNR